MRKANVVVPLIILCSPIQMLGQGLADPLILQGLDQIQVIGVQTRAIGGVSAGIVSGSVAMFSNPAGLHSVTESEVRVGGWFGRLNLKQRQDWIPDRIYGEFSLLMEGRETYLIQPVDNITPNWERAINASRPSLAALVLPMNMFGADVVLGFGGAEVMDLYHYYQNNNALNPNIGQLRPAPIPRLTGTDSLLVDWYQFFRERQGSIYAVVPALSVLLTSELSVGVAVNFLSGSSDDRVLRSDRGRFTLRPDNNFSLVASSSYKLISGQSSYRGTCATVGVLYRSQAFGAGISARSPFTLKHEWDYVMDSTGIQNMLRQSGSADVRFPWLYTLGVSFYPTEKWRMGVDYDVQELGSVEYVKADGSITRPWSSSRTFRAGAEYRATETLSLRWGYRQIARGFGEEGAGLQDESVKGSIYSVGVGIDFGFMELDGVYESANTEFIDRWLSNANFNQLSSNTFGLELAVKL